jgi:hypothetical protein
MGHSQPNVDADKIGALRAQGGSWRAIARQLGGRHRNGSQSGAKRLKKPLAGRSCKRLNLCRNPRLNPFGMH